MAKKAKKAAEEPAEKKPAKGRKAAAEQPEAPKAEKKKKDKKGAETAPLPLENESPEDAEMLAVAAAVAAETNGAETNGTEEVPEGDGKAPVNIAELTRTVEALLFAAEEPIQVREIARAASSDSNTIRKVIPLLKEWYEKERRPWDIAEVGGGWRLVTRPEFYPAIQRLKTQTAQRKLTQAALETLALIAYRQPIGRADIESVRGVGAGPVLRQLLEKKLIRISGRGTGLGQPLLYGTTDYFLEHFGLKTTSDLPKPGEFKNT